MQGFINSEQTIAVFEQRDPRGDAVPFTISFVKQNGEIREWQNVILAKNKRKMPVRSRKGSKILKFFLIDTAQVRSLHFWQIIKVNHLTRQP